MVGAFLPWAACPSWTSTWQGPVTHSQAPSWPCCLLLSLLLPGTCPYVETWLLCSLWPVSQPTVERGALGASAKSHGWSTLGAVMFVE